MIDLPAGVWAGIDADMDNATCMAAEDSQDERVDGARTVREAGWRQVPTFGGRWPHVDEVITIGLSRHQWLFVLAQSRASADLYTDLDDDESANLLRRAIAIVDSALTD